MIDVLRDWGWLLGISLGFVAAWFLQHYRLRGSGGASTEELESKEKELSEAAQAKARLDERAEQLDTSLKESKQELESSREENVSLSKKLAASEERVVSMEERIKEQKEELERIQKQMTTEFENLANRIFDEKGKKFVVQNKDSLDKLLSPLAERIKDFRERVDKTHEEGLQDRARLVEQIKSMGELNRQMTEEAQNLATALKGQAKTQGNWGEMILERVLEKSGLVAGQEYETQKSFTDEDGRRFQPDVLIKLPEEKHLVIDSKVSLVAYERCVNAEDDEDQALALKEHLGSIRSHVAELNAKGYETLYEITSPDFVLMFIPIEPAFTMAMQADDTLFDQAFRQNVVIVTPSTLLATLRTVANIWRQEKQSRNVLEIARRSGALYDKFVGFYNDMINIGKRLEQTQSAYDDAVAKLKTGRGNLVKNVEDIKALGAKAKKNLPSEALEEAALEE